MEKVNYMFHIQDYCADRNEKSHYKDQILNNTYQLVTSNDASYEAVKFTEVITFILN